MDNQSANAHQVAGNNINVLTCANHPTIIGDHKCYRCKKIICLQCYNIRGPGYGFCTECHEAEAQGLCCVLL